MGVRDFSDRYGLSPALKESIDHVSDELKTATWNVIIKFSSPDLRKWKETYFQNPIFVHALAEFFNVTDEQLYGISANDFWAFFKPKFLQLDGRGFYDLLNFISKRVLDKASIIAAQRHRPFSEVMNYVFADKGAPCEFIGFELTLKFGPQEKKSMEDAMQTPYIKVNTAIKYACTKLYEGDWKECCQKSIDGVESLLKNLLNKDHIDFSDAIQELGKKHQLHPSLIAAIKSFWGYLSQCARHESTDTYPHAPNKEDASFCLIWCTGFINLLLAKVNK